ncbi:hypothetical protein GW813_12970 [bacterium]|nr:hypothetical protein [bacterium]
MTFKGLLSLAAISRRRAPRVALHCNLSVDPLAYLSPDSVITNRETLIGRGTRVNGRLRVRGRGRLVIGNYCAIGEEGLVLTSNHEMGRANLQVNLQRRVGATDIDGEAAEVTIGGASWIGDRVVLLPTASLGPGCIVGAGAVVTKGFPPFSVVAGNPARLIRIRFGDEIVDGLMDLRWWEWDEGRLARNRDFFSVDMAATPSWETVASLVAP